MGSCGLRRSKQSQRTAGVFFRGERKNWCTAVARLLFFVDDPIISTGGTENERTETFDIRFAPVVGVEIFAGVEVRASRCR